MTDKKKLSLRLNLGLYNHIKILAKKENKSINNYIETVLFDATKFYEKDDLGLILLMQKSDRNDIVNRNEIMKTLNEK